MTDISLPKNLSEENIKNAKLRFTLHFFFFLQVHILISNRPFYSCLLSELASDAAGDLVLIQTCFCWVNQVFLMLTTCSWHLNEKSREVCMNARSHPASLAFMAR